jgi:hypothetical protein
MKGLFLAASAVALLATAPRDAYVLSGTESRATFSSAAVSQLLATQERFGGDFLWVRRHGEEYLVRDAALLQRARSFFAPMAALAPAQQAVGREEREIDREEERLEAITDRDSDRRSRSRTGEADLREARTKLEQVHAKQREIEDRERELDAREEALEREAESKLWRLVDDAIRTGVAHKQR